VAEDKGSEFDKVPQLLSSGSFPLYREEEEEDPDKEEEYPDNR